MSRTSQKLINYHSFGPLSAQHTPSASSVDYGEIVVMHNTENPLLGIKVGSSTEDPGSFAWFISSAAVVSAINAVDAAGTSEKITTLSGATSAFSASVVNNYATSADTENAIKGAINALDLENAIAGDPAKTVSAVTETDGIVHVTFQDIAIKQSQVSGLTELATTVGNNTTEIGTVRSNLETLSGKVENDYATKAHVTSAIGNLDVSDITGFGANKTLATLTEADGKIDATFQSIQIAQSQVTDLPTKLQTIEGNVSANAEHIGTVSGALQSLSSSVVTTIGTVYHVKGSVADYTALQAVTTHEVGDVYNVVAAHGTIGTSGYTPAGTNYVWVGNQYGGEGHWDPLGGTVDLTGYATSADTSNAINTVATNLSNHINTEFANVSGLVNTISATVTSDYALKSEVTGALNNLDFESTGGNSGKTVTYIKQENGAITDVVFSPIAIEKSQVDGLTTDISNITNDITNISTALSAVSSTTKTAIQSYGLGTVSGSDNVTTQSGAKAQYTAGGAATLDLSTLVIDCGDF